jgi:SAM-dependent methyltransferase
MNKVHRWLCASSVWRHEVERSILPWTLDGVQLGPHLLEIGPGPGLTTDALSTRIRWVTALEFDTRLATALGARLAGTNVVVVTGDGAAMPFGAGAFSAAVSFTMLHHVPSHERQDRLFAEVARVLEPGGWFAGSDSTPTIAFRLLHIGDTMVTVDPDTLAGRLEAAGLVDVRVDRRRGRFRFTARKPVG